MSGYLPGMLLISHFYIILVHPISPNNQWQDLYFGINQTIDLADVRRGFILETTRGTVRARMV